MWRFAGCISDTGTQDVLWPLSDCGILALFPAFSGLPLRTAVLPPKPDPRVRISCCWTQISARSRLSWSGSAGPARPPARAAPPPPHAAGPGLTAGAPSLVGSAGPAGQAGDVEVAGVAAVSGPLQREGEAAGGPQQRRRRQEQRSDAPALRRRHGYPRPAAAPSHWSAAAPTASAKGPPQEAKRAVRGGARQGGRAAVPGAFRVSRTERGAGSRGSGRDGAAGSGELRLEGLCLSCLRTRSPTRSAGRDSAERTEA